ncbi:MAG: VCBS repeat-containing protein, partial [Planctomycetota bacterium]
RLLALFEERLASGARGQVVVDVHAAAVATDVADLDGDGWNDVLITDVDVDIGGYGRRMHIYHNLTPSAGSETFLEERQQAGGNGWIGVVGVLDADLRGSHDVVVFDIDNDGDNDMVLGRSIGTFVWENKTDPELCQVDLGVGQSGAMAMEVCGQPLWQNNEATLDVTGGPNSAPAAIVVGTAQSPLPLFGGTLIPTPDLQVPVTLDPTGNAQLPLTAGPTAATLFLQTIAIDLGTLGVDFSNAVEVIFNQG